MPGLAFFAVTFHAFELVRHSRPYFQFFFAAIEILTSKENVA